MPVSGFPAVKYLSNRGGRVREYAITVIILKIGLRFLFFLDHLCHAVSEIELADCFKVSVHHMDHNLVLGLALGLAMIVELLPQLAGYAKPDLGLPPSSGERQTVNQCRCVSS